MPSHSHHSREKLLRTSESFAQSSTRQPDHSSFSKKVASSSISHRANTLHVSSQDDKQVTRRGAHVLAEYKDEARPGARHLDTSISASDHNQSTRGAHSSLASIARRYTDSQHSEYEKMRNNLNARLDKYSIGLDRKQNYMPQSDINSFVQDAIIKRTLPEATMDLVTYIMKKAQKTFLITVLAIENDEKAQRAMQAFYNHGFTDASLPVTNLTAECTVDWCNPDCVECTPSPCGHKRSCEHCCSVVANHMNSSEPRCKHPTSLDAFHHICWGRSRFKDFYNKQWSFCLQKFDTRIFRYDQIEDQRVLPLILPKQAVDKVGHFSEVQQAQMLIDYILLDSNFMKQISDNAFRLADGFHSGQGIINVAIKTLKVLSEEDYDIRKEFQSEAKAHKSLNKLENKHIIKGLAAFSQNGKYYLLSEWANGGSLQDFFGTQPKPDLDRAKVKELLEQLLGLADALHHMHITRQARTPTRGHSRRASSTSGTGTHDDGHHRNEERPSRHVSLDPNMTVPNVPDIRVGELRDDGSEIPVMIDFDKSGNSVGDDNAGMKNWRHGDIKPENILRFQKNGSWLGTLKLADLGRAKSHKNVTKMRTFIEIDKWHTQKYEPPDVFIGQGNQSTSRLYDIWSLGCVFLEALVWMLYGETELHKFLRTTEVAAAQGTPFWTRKGRTNAKISAVATMWMGHILTEDPECQGPSRTALRDLLILIKTKMLVIKLPADTDLPMEGDRINAEKLRDELQRFLHEGNKNDSYLCTGIDRSKIKAPPIGQDAIDITGKPEDEARSNLLQLPSQDRPLPVTTLRRNNTYSHTMDSKWELLVDDAFSENTLKQVLIDADHRSEIFDISPQLCTICETLDFSELESFPIRTLMKIEQNAQDNCELCSMIYKKAQLAGYQSEDPITLSDVAGRLLLNGKESAALRVCCHYDQSHRGPQPDTKHPLGFPTLLPGALNNVHVGVMKAWLQNCDEQHTCVVAKSQRYCPRRLIVVGMDGSTSCKLLDTKDLTVQQRQELRYIALSHPWGTPVPHDPKQQHFKSTKSRLRNLEKKIMKSSLPANYRDALRITRSLGIKYLWIDSICVIQKEGDNENDDQGTFVEEAPYMQDIYSSAYCVIAASNAAGMWSGFLRDREERMVVSIPVDRKSNKSQSYYYISEVVDDFEKDVLESPLSRRGWVLQERALARRTIYLTDNQTYFECGHGIRCETLSQMKSKEAAFLGDCDFPSYAEQGNLGVKLYLFTNLYADYSSLLFTHDTDRPIAISGLEQRLTKAFAKRHGKGGSGAGVFEHHRHRWLLWTRANATLARVTFDPKAFYDPSIEPREGSLMNAPPTWSWMAYHGAISFLQPPTGRITWNEALHIHFTGTAETSWLNAADSLWMKAPVFTFSPDASQKVMSIMFDIPAQERIQHNERIVIVGTQGSPEDPLATHYVLVVVPKKDSKSLTYERIGAGSMRNKYIDRSNPQVESVIIL